jgi:serine/threonine protein phosphatase PrpC
MMDHHLSLSPSGSTPFSAFGVFDGHGGKSVATFSSKNLLPLVAGYADRCRGAKPVPLPDFDALPTDLGDAQRATMAAQDALVERLPRVRRM